MFHRRKIFQVTSVSPQPERSGKTLNNKLLVFKGVFLALWSGVFYSATAVIVKQMKSLHPSQLTVYRFIAMLAISLPQVVKCGENLFGPKDLRLILEIRGIFAGTATLLSFLAFRYLPLGESAVIIYSLPVFVTVAARIFLKEPCGIFMSVTVVLTVIGIIFTAKIPSGLMGKSFVYTSENIYGLLAAVGSLSCHTCQYILIRKLKTIHHSVILFNLSFVSIIEIIPLTFIIGNYQWHKCGIEIFYILLLGVMSYAAQVLMTMAMQCEFAGPVSTMRGAADIVLSFVWQSLFFHDIPDSFSITGAVLVGFSVVFVGLIKWVSSLPGGSPQYNRLRWLVG